MRVLAWVIVAVMAAASGGFAIPMGLAFGLSSVETYLAALVGSVIGVGAVLFLADRFWGRVEDRLPEPPDPASPIGTVIDRFGVRGLGLVGPIFPGVTATVLIALVLRLDRRSLLLWLSIGVAFLFAAYVGILALLVDLVGVD